MWNRAALLGVCLVVIASPARAESPWGAWSPYARDVIESRLPASDASFDDDAAKQYVDDHGTRSSTYLAVGMLCRRRGNDIDNASRVLRELLTYQYDAPGEKRHGVWRTSPRSEKLDENWREFVGVGLILALEHFEADLPDDLVEGIDDALRRAAEGALRRNVGPHYTNIALMSAFLLAYTGERFDDASFREAGLEKCRAVDELFREHGTFAEYNSPTYYGADLLGLALWREHGPTEEMRRRGAEIEASLWRDLAAFYHADLRNMAGPYSRAYGMDMTEYVAVTGMWIALALDGEGPLPMPEGDSPRKAFELDYMPLFCLLRAVVPSDAIEAFRRYQGDRDEQRLVVSRRETHEVSLVVRKDWMMGAATGLHRRWEQHVPAAIHWKADDAGNVGWLLVRGENAADCVLVDGALEVIVPEPDEASSVRIQLHAPGIREDMIDGETWRLPGRMLEVRTELPPPTVEFVKDTTLGRVLEVRWPLDPDASPSARRLLIRPKP